MSDFKSAAEQQVRETLKNTPLTGIPINQLAIVTEEAIMAFNLAVSKTAELLEMTAQRDEAQKALELAKERIEYMERELSAEGVDTHKSKSAGGHESCCLVNHRAESAEATICEQAERIKGLQEVIDAAYRGCDCGSDPKSRLIPGHKPTCWKALHLRGRNER